MSSDAEKRAGSGGSTEEAVPLALRNASGPEPPQDRDDDGDDAQAPPKHLMLPYPVMLCRFQHGRRGRRVLGLKVPICRAASRKRRPSPLSFSRPLPAVASISVEPSPFHRDRGVGEERTVFLIEYEGELLTLEEARQRGHSP
jgi:hypothetical protein